MTWDLFAACLESAVSGRSGFTIILDTEGITGSGWVWWDRFRNLYLKKTINGVFANFWGAGMVGTCFQTADSFCITFKLAFDGVVFFVLQRLMLILRPGRAATGGH